MRVEVPSDPETHYPTTGFNPNDADFPRHPGPHRQVSTGLASQIYLHIRGINLKANKDDSLSEDELLLAFRIIIISIIHTPNRDPNTRVTTSPKLFSEAQFKAESAPGLIQDVVDTPKHAKARNMYYLNPWPRDEELEERLSGTSTCIAAKFEIEQASRAIDVTSEPCLARRAAPPGPISARSSCRTAQYSNCSYSAEEWCKVEDGVVSAGNGPDTGATLYKMVELVSKPGANVAVETYDVSERLDLEKKKHVETAGNIVG
ncbi:hypothetical protein B0H67DRAFT_672801 [Lasiosphaeris hirsuta]|uniref:Uncharacterized protein n=1 Tax=Lasiosphaeris hirsuta TaxID=260670 RepID=A0AA40A3L2_9PEZI|nr:hypothetical protein B0H67DRAFT_672801 [Lasiosphaeris hirsuta]